MSALMRQNQNRHRSAEEDAALWQRFRGAPGAAIPDRLAPRPRLVEPLTDAQPNWKDLSPIAPPDPLRGDALERGIWRHGLERFELADDACPWAVADASLHFLDRFHRFDWLGDLCAQGAAACERARSLTDAWIAQFGRFDGFAWRAGPTADRTWSWMLHGDILFGEDQGRAGRERLEVLLRQIDHAESLADAAPDVEARFRTFVVNLARTVLLRDETGRAIALERLEAECTAQLLPDGGHVSRSPQRLLNMLLDLLTIRALFEKSALPQVEFIEKWVPRMAAMLGFFRCADGALHPFNDSGEARAEQVEAALSALDLPPRRFSVSPKSGFQKLVRGDAEVLLDVGQAPEMPFGDLAHAGALGFEFADGPARIVTSCGASREVNVDWQAAVRRTGAHSTLVLGGRDSAPFRRNEASDLLSPEGPDGISAKRLEEADEIWLDAQHSGYRDNFGLLHRRRLFLAGDGRRLAGEDSLVRPISRPPEEAAEPIGFEIRFHLHPSVDAQMGRDAILLACADGRRWRFRTSHAGARLDRSVYLARGTVERTQQIVLSGRADPNGDGSEPPNCVRWAFVKEAGE